MSDSCDNWLFKNSIEGLVALVKEIIFLWGFDNTPLKCCGSIQRIGEIALNETMSRFKLVCSLDYKWFFCQNLSSSWDHDILSDTMEMNILSLYRNE